MNLDREIKMNTTLENKKPDEEASPTRRGGILTSSYFWAFVFAAAIASWMLSGKLVVGGQANGHLATEQTESSSPETAKSDETKLFAVRARTFHAQTREAVLTLRGRTEADAKVQVRAETAGMVLAVPARKGDFVKKGTILCTIEKGAREATLLEAKASFAQAEADYEAAKRLANRGHTAKLKVAEFQAKLDSARAAIRRAELDLERTQIAAPFSGIIEAQPAKVGDFLSIGGSCANLVSTDPLVIVGAVSERDITSLKTGMTARARLVTGETVEGFVRFISPASDANTRTFRTELQVANADYRLKDGITATIEIPLKSTRAHQFSPAILGLDDNGRVGVRTIVDEDKVQFVPVTILGRSDDGIWVDGLPDQVKVITVGQDYVINGQKVRVVDDGGARSS